MLHEDNDKARQVIKREGEGFNLGKAEKQREGGPLALRRAAASKGSASDQLVPEPPTLPDCLAAGMSGHRSMAATWPDTPFARFRNR